MSALAQQTAAERRQALRALLAKPLLTSADGQAFAFVRAHADFLREWLARNCGWSLQVDVELARLRKTPGDLRDRSRGARDEGSELAFSRRRYVLLCLALAALERADRQTTLGKVAGDVLAAFAGEPALAAAGMTFDLDTRDARRDLVHVVRLLLSLRVLVRVHGQEEHFVERRGDVLYNVRRPALAALLAVRRGPSTVDPRGLDFEARLEAICHEVHGDGDDARNRRLRTSLTRRLLDDPIVYFDDLDDDERAYLTSQRGHILRQIQEATGLSAEIRREGIALVDPEGDLTDVGMPEEGTEGHVALLVAEYLAGRLRQAGDDAAVPMAAVVARVADLRREHRAHWRKDALAPGAEVTLARDALARLEALRLVRCHEDAVVPLPALGRFRLLPPSRRGRPRPAQGILVE